MSDPRRLGAAALAAIPVYLAFAVFTSPGSASAAGVLPTPTPCPSGSPTPTPLINLGGCPTPTPTSSPSPPPPGSSSPGPSGSSSPGSSGGAAAPGSNQPPGSAGGAGPPTVVPGTLVIADPLLAAEVQSVLANPVSKQRPDLLHFQPVWASAGNVPSGAAGPTNPAARGAGSAMAVPIIAGGAGGALLAAVCLLLILRDRGRSWRLRPAVSRAPLLAAAPVVAVAAVLIAGSAALPAAGAAQSRAAAAPARQASLIGALRSHARSLPLAASSTTWKSLVAIETALDTQHDRLVTDEQLTAAATQQLNDASSSGAAQHSERPGYVAVLKQVLQLAVTDHANLMSAYSDSLQNEYTFFVSAAQSPQATTALQTVASHAPPEVQTAVNTDLTLVQTQLQQEAQIASASVTDTTLPPLRGPITFHAPLSGVVSQGFGPTQYSMEPPVTYRGVFYPHFHTGLDIAAPLDTPVGAAAAGKVILATSSVDSNGRLVGYGNYVVIDHGDGFLTLYGHLDKLLVQQGQIVKQGQVIGLEGSTGWSTGPHLHFEIRKSGVYVDPAPYLAAQLKP